MNGWIKINRDITSHWIFEDSWKFRNWDRSVDNGQLSRKKDRAQWSIICL